MPSPERSRTSTSATHPDSRPRVSPTRRLLEPHPNKMGSDLAKWSGRRDSDPRPSPWQGDGFRPFGSLWCHEVRFRPPSFHRLHSVRRCSRALYNRPRSRWPPRFAGLPPVKEAREGWRTVRYRPRSAVPDSALLFAVIHRSGEIGPLPVDDELAVRVDGHLNRAQPTRCRRAHDRTGTRVELGAVTRTHDELGGGGITDCAPGMGTDGVVGDETALAELEDQARVTRPRIRETRRPANRYLTGHANRSPRRCRRARSRRRRNSRGRARARPRPGEARQA